MKNPNTNIEELFKNTFENYEAEVNPNAWNNIQKNLNKPSSGTQTEGTSRDSIIRWTVAAAIMAIAVLGIWYFTKEEKQSLAEVKQDAIAVQSVKEIPSNVEPTEKNTTPSIVKEKIAPVSVKTSSKPVVQTVVETKDNLVHISQTESLVSKRFDKIETTDGEGVSKDDQVLYAYKPATIINEKNKSELLGLYTEELMAPIEANPIEGHAPLTVSFYNLRFGSAKTNIWDFGDGSALDSSSEKPTHTYLQPGNYNVTITVRGYNGKVVKNSTSVSVEKGSSIAFDKIASIFTPNDDGENDRFAVKGESLSSINVAILDVSENILYNWNTLDGYWDGKTYSGETVNDGTYIYILNAIGADGKKYRHKGLITVKR